MGSGNGRFTMPSTRPPDRYSNMPTYEYLCQDCGDRLEVFQKFSEKPLRTHDDCGGALQKVFHPSGIVFKGSGYYITDSRNGGKASSSSSSSNGSSNGSKDTKSSDSKTTDTAAAAD
jgi:putative FmdB family regulatory protein